MLEEMSWSQFLGWCAYYRIDPWGPERADLRAGIIASVIANVNRDSKKRARPFSATDYMPYAKARKSSRQPLTSVEQWQSVKKSAKAYAMAQAKGGK